MKRFLIIGALLGPILQVDLGGTAKAATCVLDDGTGVLIQSGDDGSLGTPTSNTACGTGAVAAGSDDQNTAIGNNSTAGNLSNNTSGNTALGSGSIAEGGNSIAIGTNAQATGLNSVAIGSGAIATQANQIVLGTSTNSYTLPGLASSGSFVGSTNQSGTTQFVTVDGSGNLGTSSFSAAATNSRLDSLESSMKTVNSQIENVGAMAAAFSSIPNLTSDNRKYGCGIGAGGYGSGWAGSAGCASKIGSNVWVNGAVAFTGANSTPWGSTSSVAGRLGLFYQWGGNK